MTTLTEIKIENLKAFENNPFIFREDTAFEMLIDSIANLGVLTPIIVRSLEDGNYEIISGHRRAEACKRLGIETPCFKLDECISMKMEDREMCDGCMNEGRICSTYVISGYQRIKDRIKVIICKENLGY